MDAFSAAMDAIFADRNMAADAWYHGDADPRIVRVIRRRPDAVESFGAGQFITDTVLLDVRIADVPELRVGHVFVLDSEEYEVRAEPQRDTRRLVWQVEARSR